MLDNLDTDRFEPVLLGIHRDGSWRTAAPGLPLADIVARGELVTDLRALAPELVLPVLHGPYGEDGTFQGMLEVLGLPYVGSGVLASALCMDKAVFKRALLHHEPSVPQVPWVEIDGRQLTRANADEVDRAELLRTTVARVGAQLGYPCFVKPANQGSSIGISRAHDEHELRVAIEMAMRYDPKLVIEKAIDAREIELAVLGDGGPGTIVSEPGEIVLPEGVWYDYESKYLKDVAGLEIPAALPTAVSAQLKQLTLEAFRAAGCHGLARVDFFVDRKTHAPYLNEVNTMPGFTSISMYPRLMAHAGVPFREQLTRLCALALERHALRKSLRIDR